MVDTRTNYLQGVRGFLETITSPVLYSARLPEKIIDNTKNYFTNQSVLLEKITKLRHEKLLLSGMLQKFNDLETENASLRKLLHSNPRAKSDAMVAEVINVDLEPFSHKIMLNKGKMHGVYRNQVVIDAEGIVGTVISVHANHCVVLLINDVRFGISVVNTRTGIRVIAVGSGIDHKIKLQHIPKTADLRVGDKFVSSGLGNHYPAGLPVGTVDSIEYQQGAAFAEVILMPKAKLQSAKYLLLLT